MNKCASVLWLYLIFRRQITRNYEQSAAYSIIIYANNLIVLVAIYKFILFFILSPRCLIANDFIESDYVKKIFQALKLMRNYLFHMPHENQHGGLL